jgi:hypothetical protein
MTTSKPRLIAIRYRSFLLCLATIAFGAILVETSSYGIGISPDSVKYIRLARQLAQPGELFALFGSPVFVSQPPLFPVVLAWIEKTTGADPFVSVRYLNALLFAIYVPVLIVAVSLLSDAMRYSPSGESRRCRIRTVTVLLVAMALIQPVRQFAADFGDRFREGSGLNRRVFIESELIGFLKTWGEAEREKPIFSNAPMALV